MHHGVIVAVGIILLSAIRLDGQEVRGQIIDEASGEGVLNASVVLLTSRSLPAGPRVLSNSEGRFSFPKPPPGRYRLEIQRIGYANLTTLAFELEEGGENVMISVYLVPQIIEIDPITLEVRSRAQLTLNLNPMDGFDYRAENGFGHYITEERLNSLYSTTSVMAVLQALRGITISRVNGEVVATASRAYDQCGVKWWLDGRPLRESRAQPDPVIDSVVADEITGIEVLPVEELNGVGRYSFRVPYDVRDLLPSDLAGIEVYAGTAATPGEFSWSSIEPFCAAVVVWTKLWERRAMRDERARAEEQRVDTVGSVAKGGGWPPS
jgi:hypothetical protein